MFQAPVRKKGAYVSKVTDSHGKTYRIQMSGIKIVSIHPLNDDVGYILKLWIPRQSPSYELLHELDSQAFQAVLENNQTWFSNALEETKIREYFRPSMADEYLCALISNVLPPRTIMINDQSFDSFNDVYTSYVKDKKRYMDYIVTCTLDIQGLYFYPNRFGIRWLLRDLYCSPHIEEIIDPYEYCDKHETEDFWKTELNGVFQQIEEDIQGLQEKIKKLQMKKETLETLYQGAFTEPEISETWGRNLEQLKREILEYTCGRL